MSESLPRRVADQAQHRWNRLVDWMESKTAVPISHRRAGLIVAGGVGLGLLAVSLLITVLSLLLRGTTALAHTARQLPKSELAHVGSDPIQQFLAAHTAGLPVAPSAVLAVWLTGGGVLALAGFAGSRGGRVAWPLWGAATVAMAWLGAAEPHRPVAAGLVGLTWGLLSVLVLHRGGTRPQHITVNTDARPTCDANATTPTSRTRSPASVDT